MIKANKYWRYFENAIFIFAFFYISWDWVSNFFIYIYQSILGKGIVSDIKGQVKNHAFNDTFMTIVWEVVFIITLWEIGLLVYEGIKSEKPLVKFGISPFGVYRPGIPPSIAGFDQYGILYADAKLWLNEGWIDYFTPQLYWPISRVELSYPVLLNWWQSENTLGRNLWPGLFIRPEVERKEMTLEILNQIMVTRGIVPQSPGTMLFSMRSLMSKDTTITKALINGPFKTTAISPAYAWLDNKSPAAPQLTVDKLGNELKINWQPAGDEKPFLYVLYTKVDETWSYEVFSANIFSVSKQVNVKRIFAVAISAIDRCGNESDKTIWKFE